MNKARRRPVLATGILLLLIATLGGAARSRAAGASNDTDPLLDLFIKKGFVTQREAEQVEAEAQALRTNEAQMPQSPPSKWKISSGIKSAQLFGDVRLRYEDRSAADPAGNQIDLGRFRYAVRVGLRGDLFDQFYYGFRLDTGVNPRSSFVTLGTSASGGPYQGPFGKSNGGINVGLVYLGWRPEDWLDLTVGKMPNPLYTTPMVWSGNLNPEGFAERFKYTVGSADLFANFGQFLYSDLNPDFASANLGIGVLPGQSAPGTLGGGQQTENTFMLAWQGGADVHIATNVSAKIAATIYNYIGLQNSSGTTATSPYFGDPYVGEGAYYYYAGGSGQHPAPGYSGYDPGYPFTGGSTTGGYGSLSFPFNQVGLNNLMVLEVPFEFNFKIRRMDARVFGDFAYNLEGAQRARDAANAYSQILANNLPPYGNALAHSFPAQTSDVKAYQIGLEFGSHDSLGLINGRSPRRHSWEVMTYWQHIEQYALDPNLLDSDFFEGRENMQGIYVGAAYGLTDDLILAFRYGHASRINNLLGTGGSNQDIPQINPINSYDIYQADLTLKF